MKTAVLIHGFHLGAQDWKSIVWGNTHRRGPIPQGVMLAWEEQADLICWGTGASEREGKKEAEFIYAYAVQRISELASMLGIEPETLRAFLAERSVLDTRSQNTREEITTFLAEAKERSIERVYLVSNATHAPRSLAVGLAVREQNDHSLEVHAAPARTTHTTGGPDAVCVVEPPHRGDLPMPPAELYPNVLAKRMFAIQARDHEAYVAYLGAWDRLLRDYGA